MAEQSAIDELVATLIGAALFSAVVAGVAMSYAPPASAVKSRPPATPTPSPTATQTPRPTPTATSPPPSPTPSSTPTPQPSPTPTPLPTATADPAALGSEPQDHHWFKRPIAADGRNYVSRFYPYGSTAGGQYQVHHGVEFENPTGTPIQAAGPGRVIVAGRDNSQVYGLLPDFYGQLVVIEHDRTFRGQPVFTLYGHLSKVQVEVGQEVEAGQIIGEVGATGIALGPHLHMEVRVGQNSYDATRNPELWIQPFEGHGTIAGRLLNADGDYIAGALVSLYDDQNAWHSETETYGDGANPDAGWQENFVFGDVPAGQYTIQYTFDDRLYSATVKVETGKTTPVILQVSR